MISEVPEDDETAVAFYEALRTFADFPGFSELKRTRRAPLDLPLTIDEAPPLLVLRTSPGAANAIARAVDLLPLDGIVGTLAGDDTIFIACRDRDTLRRIRTQFEALRAGEEV